MTGQELRDAAIGDLGAAEQAVAEAALKAAGISWERLAHDGRRCARMAEELLAQHRVPDEDVVKSVAIGAYAQGVFLTLAHIVGKGMEA